MTIDQDEIDRSESGKALSTAIESFIFEHGKMLVQRELAAWLLAFAGQIKSRETTIDFEGAGIVAVIRKYDCKLPDAQPE